MVLGLILILAGIAIAVYPPFLAFIVASVLVFWGISLLYISYYYRKVSRKFNDPFIDFFFNL